MQKYVWCEDSGSGFEFWKILFHIINSEVIVESKKNNTRLRQAVDKIADDDDNQYYILLDTAIDNPDVLREIKKLISISNRKKNVKIVNVHSFEFVLLSFRELENWVFAEQDELKEKRQQILYWKDVFVGAFINEQNPEVLDKVKEMLKYSEKYNSEQLSAKLLFEITKNTGFETDKGNLGECFKVDCCEWESKEDDDICGLDMKKYTLVEKMKRIYDQSVLKQALAEVEI